jgi:hypothetical protein
MKTTKDIKVRIEQRYGIQGYKLYIMIGNDILCNNGTMYHTKEGVMYPENAGISLPDDCLQEIMDELYRYGIRPTKFKDITGELEAKIYHLEDMRKLVFKGK